MRRASHKIRFMSQETIEYCDNAAQKAAEIWFSLIYSLVFNSQLTIKTLTFQKIYSAEFE